MSNSLDHITSLYYLIEATEEHVNRNIAEDRNGMKIRALLAEAKSLSVGVNYNPIEERYPNSFNVLID